MLGYLAVFFMAMPGPLIPAANTELILLYATLHEGLHPVPLVLAASGGQALTALMLHALGEQTLRRWSWMARRLDRLADVQRQRFQSATTLFFTGAALLGLPPMAVLAPVSSTWNYPRWRMALLIFTGRVVRFGALLAAAQAGWQWFQG